MKGYEFPKHPTPVKISDTVCVIGAGNVAMDAARTAKRLGAKNVYIVYRRGEQEIPARAEEVHHAKEEGIIFKLLTNPVKIEGKDGWVHAMECVEMELGEPDESGRRRPVVKEGSNFVIETGTVIVSIGQSPNPLIRQTTPGLDTQKWGGIIVDTSDAESQGDDDSDGESLHHRTVPPVVKLTVVEEVGDFQQQDCPENRSQPVDTEQRELLDDAEMARTALYDKQICQHQSCYEPVHIAPVHVIS